MDVEGPQKHRVNPLNPEDVPQIDLSLFQEGVQLVVVFADQVFEADIDVLDVLQLEDVGLVEECLLQHQVAEHLEGLVGGVVEQQHDHHVTHSLHVADVRPVDLEHFEQNSRLQKQVLEFELALEVLVSPLDVFLDLLIFLALFETLLVEAVKQRLIDSNFVSDEKLPNDCSVLVRNAFLSKTNADFVVQVWGVGFQEDFVDDGLPLQVQLLFRSPTSELREEGLLDCFGFLADVDLEVVDVEALVALEEIFEQFESLGLFDELEVLGLQVLEQIYVGNFPLSSRSGKEQVCLV